MSKYRRIIVFFFAILALSLPIFLFPESRPYLTVIGPTKMADGIGRQSVELMHALSDTCTIGYIPTNQPCLEDVPEKVIPLIKHPIKKLGKIILFEEPFPTPSPKFFKSLNKRLKGPKKTDQIRIAYSMIESSRIPSQWAEGLNTYFDAVAVPDKFLVEVYEQSGVKIPIFVLPLGLDMDHFLKQPLKTSRNTPFRFINVSSLISRKNHEALIKAFHIAFQNHPDVELCMNYRYVKGDLSKQIEELIHSLGATNIYLTNEKLDKERYLHYFLEADAFASLSKGEGFSIQPREAMALGLPVIISDNTAHKTIIQTGLACGVCCPIKTAAYNPFLKCICGEEALADIQEAAKCLRDVYENYEAYQLKADERRKWAASYRFENLKPLYLNLVKPAKVSLGKENTLTEEGLTTNSKELFEKYLRIISED